MKPPEIDIGGDSGRFYFFDPWLYLRQNIFGKGAVAPEYPSLGHVLFLGVLSSFLRSPYALITLNSIWKLVGGYLSVRAIILLVTRRTGMSGPAREIGSTLGGLLYTLMPTMTGNYEKALLTHNQVVVNPLVMYLVLKYVLTGTGRYAFVLLVLSVLFSMNFSVAALPDLLSYYPFMITFVFLYVRWVEKKSIRLRRFILPIVLYLLLHMYHLAPSVAELFLTGSDFHTIAFNPTFASRQVDYFYGVLSFASVSNKFLMSGESGLAKALSFVYPAVILWGLAIRKRTDRTMVWLLGVPFLILWFLLSAKVTSAGVKLYALMFMHVPGFSMFRNFVGRFLYGYSVFYALLFGYMLARIASEVQWVRRGAVILGVAIILTGWTFITGAKVNPTLFSAPGLRLTYAMDDDYRRLLEFFRGQSDGNSVLSFPFTDSYVSLVSGTTGGVFMGNSPVQYLAGKRDLNGYLMIHPFGNTFLRLLNEQNFGGVRSLLTVSSVGYVLHNQDPNVYGDTVPGYPYDHVRKFLPGTQSGLGEIVQEIGGTEVFTSGPYSVRKLALDTVQPAIFVPERIRGYVEDMTYPLYREMVDSVQESGGEDYSVAYVDQRLCDVLPVGRCADQPEHTQLSPEITFRKVAVTKYHISVTGGQAPFVLVAGNSPIVNWNLFVLPESPTVAEPVNSYARYRTSELDSVRNLIDTAAFETVGLEPLRVSNFPVNYGRGMGWLIRPDIVGQDRYQLVLQWKPYTVFYASLFISAATLGIGCGWVVGLIVIKTAKWSRYLTRWV